ncbi:MAG: polysaccharide export protein, partial [Hyphomicrobiaceae bacterium TMED74]
CLKILSLHGILAGDEPSVSKVSQHLGRTEPRIFVYGEPNLSRLYNIGHDGKISVPLIGNVSARGKTVGKLKRVIAARLGARYVRDPQVSVDVQQNRPFYILGEVRSAGQYPFASGMTVRTAVAIAGGYTERADENSAKLTRRVNGFVEEIEATSSDVVRPGDTIYIRERFF